MKDYIAKAYRLAKAERQAHEDEISEAYLYTRPNRDIFRADSNSTDRTKIYDSTAPEGVQNLVSTILNLLIPQNQQWATLGVREDLKDQVAYEVKSDLDRANRTVFKTLKDSNFYVASSEALTDAVISGVGCIATYEDKNINFIAIPSYQLYFLDNHRNEVDTVFRDHALPGHYLLETYGSKLGEDLRASCQKDPYKPIKILESCFRMPGEKDFTYVVQLSEGGEILDQKKLPVQMFCVFRFGKTVGDIWGESPVRQALPHIRVLNEAVMLFMQSAAYLSLGAWQVSSDTAVNFGNMKLRPGDVVTVDQPLQAIPFAGNVNITEVTIQGHRQMIRSMLFNDVVLPPDKPTYQTAAEVQVRQATFFQRIGPYGLRLEQEFLRQIISSLIVRLQMRGEISQFKAGSELLELTVNSAVKRGIALTEITRDLQILQQVSALGPDALRNVDLQKMARKILRDGDMSPEVIRSELQVREELEQIAAQQQQAQLQQLAVQLQESQAQTPTAP